MIIVPLATISSDAIDALLDRAFGADRRMRTAYRLREGVEAIDALSFAALEDDGTLIGSTQSWPVALFGDDAQRHPMILVGPVAVEPIVQRSGIGRLLTQHLLDATAGSSEPGADALMLIGDPEYYGRFFGFSAVDTAKWRLPGPFEGRRLLARGKAVPDRPGIVGPRPLP